MQYIPPSRRIYLLSENHISCSLATLQLMNLDPVVTFALFLYLFWSRCHKANSYASIISCLIHIITITVNITITTFKATGCASPLHHIEAASTPWNTVSWTFNLEDNKILKILIALVGSCQWWRWANLLQFNKAVSFLLYRFHLVTLQWVREVHLPFFAKIIITLITLIIIIVIISIVMSKIMIIMIIMSLFRGWERYSRYLAS